MVSNHKMTEKEFGAIQTPVKKTESRTKVVEEPKEERRSEKSEENAGMEKSKQDSYIRIIEEADQIGERTPSRKSSQQFSRTSSRV